MELKIGDKCGCLEVIGGCEEAEADFAPIIKRLAEEEWNKFEYNCYRVFFNFYEYFELSEEETKAYYNQDSMPITFVDKFRNHYRDFKNVEMFLYHDQHPGTFGSLLTAIRAKQLYKVRCNKCGKIYYMDADSITCVEWHCCKNSKCANNNPTKQISDYSKSLYSWHSDTNELQVLNHQLAIVDQLGNSLSYYSNDSQVRISYISDIHLGHHLKYYDNDEEKMIRIIGDRLYNSSLSSDIVIFDGDISSDKELFMDFFSYYMRRYDLVSFKRFRNELSKLKAMKEMIADDQWYKILYAKLSMSIEKLKRELLPEFDFIKFDKYKKKYKPTDSNTSAFEYYRRVKSFKSLELSDLVIRKIEVVVSLLDLKEKKYKEIEDYKCHREKIKHEIESFESQYCKKVEEITLLDYKHSYRGSVFVVLGNHDYIAFENVDAGVEYYKNQLSKIGIMLLHNTYKIGDECLIYGGTGFAKYDTVWNADSLVCCKGFSREDEIKETDAFEKGYYDALSYAKKYGLCFICVSHYPVSACLNNHYEKEAIYFTGHTHINEFIKNEEKVVYADNQIGYKSNDIYFKKATTGLYLNPYGELGEGLYKTSVDDYLEFYRYIGEKIGNGKLLNNRLKNGDTDFYVLKRKGYYGFFLLRKTGVSKGISIVNGGATKKLTSSTEMSWVCENFDIILSKYLQSMIPLRKLQEQLSKELKDLGLDGKIHGTIVDIDFFHHIMINLYDNSISYYYSPNFGAVEALGSFDDVIKSLSRKHSFILSGNEALSSKKQLDIIQEKYNQKSANSQYLLASIHDKQLIESYEQKTAEITSDKLVPVSRTGKIYGLSRNINQLQRLFSGHVLRLFDLSLTETSPQSFRHTLYNGKRFIYDFTEYVVVEDNGTEMIVAEIVDVEATNKTGSLQSTGVRESFSITALKNAFSKGESWRYSWVK